MVLRFRHVRYRALVKTTLQGLVTVVYISHIKTIVNLLDVEMMLTVTLIEIKQNAYNSIDLRNIGNELKSSEVIYMYVCKSGPRQLILLSATMINQISLYQSQQHITPL